jgi:hypothetical protein
VLQPIQYDDYVYVRDLCLSVFVNEHYYYISYHLPCKRVPISLRRRRYCNGETSETTFSHIHKSLFCFQTTQRHRGRSPDRVIESDFSGTTPTRGTTVHCGPDSLLLLLTLVFRLVYNIMVCPVAVYSEIPMRKLIIWRVQIDIILELKYLFKHFKITAFPR